jgi:hypothetical protein
MSGYQTVVSGVKKPKELANLELLADFDGMLNVAIGRPREGPAQFDVWISPFGRFQPIKLDIR